VAQQRWAIAQLMQASMVDAHIAKVFKEVSWMIRHPAELEMLRRAIAINEGSTDHDPSPTN
jgi:hypothetical protein